MQHNTFQIKPIEKIISILSYLTMGIVGLIWIIIAYACKKNLKYFLMYNVAQSMVISIILALIKLVLDILIPFLWLLPIINYIANFLNFLISVKIIRLYFPGISFTAFEFIVFVLLIYLIIGVLLGRIFYVPGLTKLMKKAMQNYN